MSTVSLRRVEAGDDLVEEDADLAVDNMRLHWTGWNYTLFKVKGKQQAYVKPAFGLDKTRTMTKLELMWS